jgi:hypothetical protein
MSQATSLLASPLPPSLLERLALDNREVDLVLRTSSPAEAIPLVKDTAERRLLSLTDRAITGVEDIMTNGQPKERLAASLAILDRSPATKPKDALAAAGITLPPDAVAALITGLGSLFNAMSPVAASPNIVTSQPKHSHIRNVTPIKGEPL